MTSQDLVHKLTGYYNSGKYSSERLTELDRFCEGIADRDREAVYEAITDTRSMNTPISKADVREACVRVGIPYKATQYLADMRVTCDCCGEQFKYNPAPSDDQELNFGVHARCPNCGFQYAWTTQASATREFGKEVDWYDE